MEAVVCMNLLASAIKECANKNEKAVGTMKQCRLRSLVEKDHRHLLCRRK